MKHLGDITKLNGAEIPVVDVITGGSPCQDLSVAGKRAGLDGERSGLFMEQIRIVKEMRERDRRDKGSDFNVRPRFMVWENVPGAFSSNGGKDFQAVLTEIVRIVEPAASDVPMPPKKWLHAGCIYDELGRWSIAWRVHDAQFWGVPQRRKRIALVADFGGQSAPEICFERKGLSGDFAESGTQGERTAGTAEKGTDSTIGFNRERNGAVTANGIMPTLQAAAGESGNNKPMVVYGISSYDSNAMKSNNPHSGIYKADTSRTLDLNGGSPACNQGGMAVFQSAGFDGNMGAKAGNIGYEEEKAPTLNAGKQMQCICIEGNRSRPSHKGDGYAEGEVMYTLNSTEHHAVAVESHAQDARYNVREVNQPLSANMEHDPANGGLVMAVENHPNDSRVKISEDGKVQTLSSRMGTGGGNVPMVMEQHTFANVAACRNVQDGRGGVHSQMMDDPEGNFVLDTVTASKATFFTGTHQDGVAETLLATDYKDPQVVAYGVDAYNQSQSEEVAKSLNSAASDADHVPCVYGLDRASFNQGINAQYDFQVDEEKVGTQVAQGPGAVCQSVVRRLTPLECERLQGFPDGWTDIGEWVDSKGKKHKESDSPRYKALGNSIAVGYANNGSGFWMWLLKRISAQYERNATLGSLFDGIGGFPLCWERCNGKGTAIWASEIEEFPIAVTRMRFPEEDG